MMKNQVRNAGASSGGGGFFFDNVNYNLHFVSLLYFCTYDSFLMAFCFDLRDLLNLPHQGVSMKLALWVFLAKKLPLFHK